MHAEQPDKQLSLNPNIQRLSNQKAIDKNIEKEFEALFKNYFKALHAYAFGILNDDVGAEEIVQNVFLKLWERKELLQTEESLRPYLYKCVYHDSLNYIRHTKVRNKFAEYVKHQNAMEGDAAERTQAKELEHNFRQALNELPQQCRTVFQMSRFQNLKYKEIAEALNISVKTVEVHMGKALKSLRFKLVDYLPILLCLATCIKLLIVAL